MNNFGLGLVLSFTDEATPGIQRVTQAYEAMENSFNRGMGSTGEALASQVGMNLSSLGDSLMGLGDSITDMFKRLLDNVKSTGSDFESFRITLGSVYKDADVAQQKIDQLLEFSKKSPFEIEDTKDMLLVLKAAGIDAFEEMTSASDGFSQQALSWITDIMAFKPEIPVSRWKLALTNFLGSGQPIVLRNILDSGNIEDIIGRDIADTAEGRMQDLMDIVSNLGLENLTNELFGTMEQQASNLGDVFTEMYLKIADKGAFDSIKRIQNNLISILTGDEVANSMDTITTSISDAIVSILEPIERLTEKIHDLGIALVDFVSKHPQILKIGLVFFAVTGSALKLLGVITKLGGAVTAFLASIKYLSGGMGIFSMLRIGLWNILKVFGPLCAAAYLLYKVWDANIGGVQDKISNMVTNVIDTISLIWDAFEDNTLSVENFEKAKEMGILPLIEAILQVKYHWGFFVDGLKKGLDAFVLSLSNVLTKLGILDADVSGFGDLVVALLEKMTAPGMTDTWEQVGYLIGECVGWILLGISLLPVVVKSISAIIGIIKTIVGAVKVIVFVVKNVINLLRILWNVGKLIVNVVKAAYLLITNSSILTSIGSIFSAIGNGCVTVLAFIGEIVIAILGAFGIVVTLPAWLVGLIVVAIVALVTLIIVFWDEIKAFFINLGNTIANVFTKAWELFTNLPWVQSVINFVQGIVQNVKGAFSNVVTSFKGVVSNIISALSPILVPVLNIIRTVSSTVISVGQSLWSIIKSIASAVVTVVTGIIDIFKAIALAIWNVLKSIFNVIKSVVLGAWNIIKSVAHLIVSIFNVIYQAIRVVVLGIIWAFQQLWNLICTGLSYVGDFFSSVFNWIYTNVVEPIVSAIGSAFEWVYNNVISPVISAIGSAFEWLHTYVIEPVCNFFKAAFEQIANVVDWLVEKFNLGFTAIKDWICGAIQAASDFVTPIIEGIADAIEWVANGISSIIDAASGALDWVGGKLESAGDFISSAVGLSTGGYVKTEGIAMLHPNEVVVNDTLTRGLGSFLADYNNAKVTSSPLIKQDVVSTDDYHEGTNNPILPQQPVVMDNENKKDYNSPMQSIVNNNTSNTYSRDSVSGDNTSQDNSVTFEAGSVVINIDKDTDLSEEGLDQLVDKMMKKMARKMQLRNMQTRV